MTRLFHDFLVRWVQQLQWQSSSLTDVKDSFTQAVLPKSFLFYLRVRKDWRISPSESSSHLSFIQQICSTLYRIQGTNAGVNQWPLWDHCETVRQPKVRTIKSVSSQCWWLKKLEPGRHLRPCVGKTLSCWCCVTTAMQTLWLRFRFAARMSTACCSARISQQKYDIVQSFRSLLSFKSSRGISATEWMEVAGLKSLGVAAAIRRFGRCCTAKGKQHLSHKQRMKIHPEWNQRSLSHGAIL